MNAEALLPLSVCTAFAQTPEPKPPLGSASQPLLDSSSPLLRVLPKASRTFTGKAVTLGDLKGQASSVKAEGKK